MPSARVPGIAAGYSLTLRRPSEGEAPVYTRLRVGLLRTAGYCRPPERTPLAVLSRRQLSQSDMTAAADMGVHSVASARYAVAREGPERRS